MRSDHSLTDLALEIGFVEDGLDIIECDADLGSHQTVNCVIPIESRMTGGQLLPRPVIRQGWCFQSHQENGHPWPLPELEPRPARSRSVPTVTPQGETLSGFIDDIAKGPRRGGLFSR